MRYDNGVQEGEKAVKVIVKSKGMVKDKKENKMVEVDIVKVLQTIVIRKIDKKDKPNTEYYSIGIASRHSKDTNNRKLGLKIARGRCEKIVQEVLNDELNIGVFKATFEKDNKIIKATYHRELNDQILTQILNMISNEMYHNITDEVSHA